MSSSLFNILLLLYILNVLYVSPFCRYLSSLILVEGMDIDFLHKCALEDCTEQHQFSSAPDILKVWPESVNALHKDKVQLHNNNTWSYAHTGKKKNNKLC